MKYLKACIDSNISDQFYNCDKEKLFFKRGEINERLGKPDLALGDYNNILTLFPNSKDTTYAIWRKLYLNAVLTDTTYGEVFDSLYTEYLNRVNTDICYLDTVSYNPPPPPPPPKMPELADIDISALPPGIYFLKATAGGRLETAKFVKVE